MKNVLITGAGSYIGTSFENYVKENYTGYIVDSVDMMDASWREKDFSDVLNEVAITPEKDRESIVADIVRTVSR